MRSFIYIYIVSIRYTFPGSGTHVNSLRPRQNGRHVADDILKCIFLNENIWILTKISVNYVPYGLIDNMAALVQIVAWRRPGDKPLSEPMMGKFGDAYMRLSASMSQWICYLCSGFNKIMR